ncbi:MAG: methyltransferase domain-containing protein [Lachnospiraceae bacterium]|nr:methyltransferase domain-containing protein [Lachnospiraceae bacterium]
MSELNDTSSVKQQYATSEKLSTRISIHDKYSTNKTGFANWIFSNYRIEPGMKILELGCGTGDMWKNKEKLIRSCAKLVLSDFSETMVETAKNKLGEYDNVEYRTIDIQDIPYDDGCFEAVIANMMLYHVPDINKALGEVSRVLKDGGSFYCATFGEHGIVEYLAGVLGDYGVGDDSNKNFTLQNGGEILKRVFPKVEKLGYKDSLAVTELDDMVGYIYSLSSMTRLCDIPRETIKERLAREMENGVLNVPKEYGMFVAVRGNR